MKRHDFLIKALLCLVILSKSYSLGGASNGENNIFADSQPDAAASNQFRALGIQGSVAGLRFNSDGEEGKTALREEQASIIQEAHQIFEGMPMQIIKRQENIANLIFLSVPITNDDEELDLKLRKVPGVIDVFQSMSLEFERPAPSSQDDEEERMLQNIRQVSDIADSYLGISQVREEQCLTGKGIRVAVLDSGLDYTHATFGGSGNVHDYDYAKQSTTPRADGIFPTERVVEGYNFVPSSTSFHDDTNPIDQKSGHGTMVASCVTAMAPEAEIIALKVCSDSGFCPDYAVIEALDFAFEHGARIANLSLGQPYIDGYYYVLTRILEDMTKLGMVIVVASGNYGNHQFILSGMADAPNAITVGATSSVTGRMAFFSSRGPGILNGLKPDISAPGSTMILADAGSGQGGRSARGTSFASPIVAGAAALLLQKCPECSPFAIKAMLMNNAAKKIQYEKNRMTLAPVSLSGSGELSVRKAIHSDFWAYDFDKIQPSISLGVVDVASDMVIKRRIEIVNISGQSLSLLTRAVFRDMDDLVIGALTISVQKPYTVIPGTCDSSAIVDIEFRINAEKVPSNHMATGGTEGRDAKNLDINEFDGWIVISNNGDDDNSISLPFHAILRKVADVSLATKRLPTIGSFPTYLDLGIQNRGMGTAQLEVFELLATSHDEEEPEASNLRSLSSADFRYIGYKTKSTSDQSCGDLLEFAFHLWERKQTINNLELHVLIDIAGDSNHDFILANRSPNESPEKTTDCKIQNRRTGQWTCSGYAPEHAANSHTVVLRACSRDFGIDPESIIRVSFQSKTAPSWGVVIDSSPYTTISMPSSISPPSFDLDIGDGLIHNVPLIAPSRNSAIPNSYALGLVIITNAHRSVQNTGASTSSSEAFALPFPGVSLPLEKSPDELTFPSLFSIGGPSCSWKSNAGSCSNTRLARQLRFSDIQFDAVFENRHLVEDKCVEKAVPRTMIDFSPMPRTASPTTRAPTTAAPTQWPSARPSPVPSQLPSTMPSRRPSGYPSMHPSVAPSRAPIFAQSQSPLSTFSNTPVSKVFTDDPFVANSRLAGVFTMTLDIDRELTGMEEEVFEIGIKEYLQPRSVYGHGRLIALDVQIRSQSLVGQGDRISRSLARSVVDVRFEVSAKYLGRETNFDLQNTLSPLLEAVTPELAKLWVDAMHEKLIVNGQGIANDAQNIYVLIQSRTALVPPASNDDVPGWAIALLVILILFVVGMAASNLLLYSSDMKMKMFNVKLRRRNDSDGSPCSLEHASEGVETINGSDDESDQDSEFSISDCATIGLDGLRMPKSQNLHRALFFPPRNDES